jgi:hypothetical protein
MADIFEKPEWKELEPYLEAVRAEYLSAVDSLRREIAIFGAVS